MLNFLSIQNIVLINEAKLDFVENYNYKGGLFILSGETGSGKSILLDALGLAIGSRANVRLIGEASNSAVVIAEFDIANNLKCREILNNYQLLDQESPNLLRIRRIIYKDEANNHGSKIYVNDNSISLTSLTQIGDNLIEINGQHYQHGLLNNNIHHFILDEFAYAAVFTDWAAIRNQTIVAAPSFVSAIGIGLSLGSEKGSFKLNYALGSYLGQPYQLNAGKIHLAYISYF